MIRSLRWAVFVHHITTGQLLLNSAGRLSSNLLFVLKQQVGAQCVVLLLPFLLFSRHLLVYLNGMKQQSAKYYGSYEDTREIKLFIYDVLSLTGQPGDKLEVRHSYTFCVRLIIFNKTFIQLVGWLKLFRFATHGFFCSLRIFAPFFAHGKIKKKTCRICKAKLHTKEAMVQAACHKALMAINICMHCSASWFSRHAPAERSRLDD